MLDAVWVIWKEPSPNPHTYVYVYIYVYIYMYIICHVSMSVQMSRYAVLPEHLQYLVYHDDVIKWKHFPRHWPFEWGIHRSPVNSPHKGQWRGAFMFSFICAWINRGLNNREAGDLRHYRAHYDVIAMPLSVFQLLYLHCMICYICMFCSYVFYRKCLYRRGVTKGPLHWRHNELDGVSDHQPHDCLLTCLFRHRSNKTSKIRVTGLCEGNSPGTGEFPAQKPITRKMFPFDDVIMNKRSFISVYVFTT